MMPTTATVTATVETSPKAHPRHLQQLGRYLAPYKLQLGIAFAAVLFSTSAILGMGVALRSLIDLGLSKGDGHLLNLALLGMLCLVGLLAVASYIRFLLVFSITERMIADLRRDIYANILTQDLAFFDAHHSGDLISRLTTDTTLLQTILGSSVSVIVRNVLIVVGGLAMLLHTHWQLTLIVLLIVPVTVVPIVILGRKVRKLARETQARLGAVNALAGESILAVRTLKTLNAESYNYAGFNGRLNDLRDVSLQRIKGKALLIAIVIFLIFSAIISVLWLGGQKMLDGRISAGELSAFVFYSALLVGAVGALSEVYADLQRASGAVERMFELLGIHPLLVAPANPSPLPDLASALIHFDNVYFSYQNRQNAASLSGFSLHINTGETVAIVGHSGAGKSTLFKLLLRFYDPDRGEIRINDTPIHALDPKQLRASIGVVPQEPQLFSGSIRENICMGLEVSDAQLKEATKAAQALAFIEALPEGFDTDIGEGGLTLSGGERQRISIARALIRNPKLLLLDEATSALDAENEAQVQKALVTLMQGRTTLVIAHRLSTVRHADRIVLLEAGNIEAIGTHEELLASQPLYQQFVKLQLL